MTTTAWRRMLLVGGLVLWTGLAAAEVARLAGVPPALPTPSAVLLAVAAGTMTVTSLVTGLIAPVREAFTLGYLAGRHDHEEHPSAAAAGPNCW